MRLKAEGRSAFVLDFQSKFSIGSASNQLQYFLSLNNVPK